MRENERRGSTVTEKRTVRKWGEPAAAITKGQKKLISARNVGDENSKKKEISSKKKSSKPL